MGIVLCLSPLSRIERQAFADNIAVEIDAGAPSAQLEALAAKLKRPRDLLQTIA